MKSDQPEQSLEFLYDIILKDLSKQGLVEPHRFHIARMKQYVQTLGQIESTGGKYLENLEGSSARGRFQILEKTFPDTIRNAREIYEANNEVVPVWLDDAAQRGRENLTDTEAEVLFWSYVYRQESSHETFAGMLTGNVDAATKLYTDWWHKGVNMKSAQLRPTDPAMEALIPPEQPAWLQRGLDPSSPTTKWNEAVKTHSYLLDDGTAVLVPTIRMNSQGKLYNPKDPLRVAIDKGDYITVEGGIEAATSLSKYISNVKINNARNKQVASNKLAHDRAFNHFSNASGFGARLKGFHYADHVDTAESTLIREAPPEGELYPEPPPDDILAKRTRGGGMDYPESGSEKTQEGSIISVPPSSGITYQEKPADKTY